MSNNFITKISPSVRIVALFLLILCLLLAKSIYLILFITILTIILIIIIDEKVNIYVNMLKKINKLSKKSCGKRFTSGTMYETNHLFFLCYDKNTEYAMAHTAIVYSAFKKHLFKDISRL